MKGRGEGGVGRAVDGMFNFLNDLILAQFGCNIIVRLLHMSTCLLNMLVKLRGRVGRRWIKKCDMFRVQGTLLLQYASTLLMSHNAWQASQLNPPAWRSCHPSHCRSVSCQSYQEQQCLEEHETATVFSIGMFWSEWTDLGVTSQAGDFLHGTKTGFSCCYSAKWLLCAVWLSINMNIRLYITCTPLSSSI